MSTALTRVGCTGKRSVTDDRSSTTEEAAMPNVRVHNFTISLDGYGAGPDQSLQNPLGVGGEQLHEWAVATSSWRQTHGQESGDEGSLDDRFMARGEEGIGATVMGRNMFGPIRGPWGNEQWGGWWGDNPPFHHPVFVLTHHPQAPITTEGGTTFHFVDDGIDSALRQALDAAGGQDVRIGGGASTIQQYLRAGLIDEMHLAIAPILLDRGERLFDNLDGGPAGYECVELVCSPSVAHVRIARMPT
jgi:dihydrofolate reductase